MTLLLLRRVHLHQLLMLVGLPPQGGIKRRCVRAVANSVSESAGSSSGADLPLMRSLRQQWAKGTITSKMVQEFAWGAMQQGAQGVVRAAALGRCGDNPRHLHASLVRLFGTPIGAPEFTWVSTPTTKGDVFVPVLLPHEFFRSLFNHRRSMFDECVMGPVGEALRFWEFMANTDFVKGHPHLPSAHRSMTVPLGLHGDAGPFSKQDSLFVLSWNSLIGRSLEGFARRFIFAIVRKAEMNPDGSTLDRLWHVFAWSMNALLTGITPSEDWDGHPIAGGGLFIANRLRGALVQVRGDWEFYYQVLGFPHWKMPNACVGSAMHPTRLGVSCGQTSPTMLHGAALAWITEHMLQIWKPVAGLLLIFSGV